MLLGFALSRSAGAGRFFGEGAIEAFDFPVGLRPVGSGPHVFDFSQGGREGAGSLAGAVVGHHDGDGDAGLGEELFGAHPEHGCGFFFLVVRDL